MEWVYNKATYNHVLTTPLVHICCSRAYAKRLTATVGKQIGEPRTTEDKNKKIQLRGYADVVGRYVARVSFKSGYREFYGNTLESVQRKALCHYRNVLRESLAAAG